MFLRTFYIILCVATLSIAVPYDWKVIERLIEENPYIVALLSQTFDYICTGTVIDERTVLTSGICVKFDPKHVAVGVAVIGAKTGKSSIHDVAYTQIHGEYNYDMKAAEPNITRMHSNIGLVFVSLPMLLLYIPAADLGNYYAAELQNIELTTVGYGAISGSPNVVLQSQNFNQAPCANPRWYYCICGVEESSNKSRTYENHFGNGAPVFFGAEVVGVAASASGTLTLKSTGEKYNIFTVIGPYLAWIERVEHNTMAMRMRSAAIRNQSSFIIVFVCVLLLINEMCY